MENTYNVKMSKVSNIKMLSSQNNILSKTKLSATAKLQTKIFMIIILEGKPIIDVIIIVV